MVNKVIILVLIFFCSIIFINNFFLKKKINNIYNIERIEYNKKIREWKPPINIKLKEPKNGWGGNRYNG